MGCKQPLFLNLLRVVILCAVLVHTMQPAPLAVVGRPFDTITKGIQVMAESGHPSILQRSYGAPYWATLRVKIIHRLQANFLWDVLLVQAAQFNPPQVVDVIDGIGGATNIPHPPIDANTVREQCFQIILAFLAPGALMALLMKIYRDRHPMLFFITKLDAIFNKSTRAESRSSETKFRDSRWKPSEISFSLFRSLDDIDKATHERHEANLQAPGNAPWTVPWES